MAPVRDCDSPVVETWEVKLIGLPGECEIRWHADGGCEVICTAAETAKAFINAALDGNITVVTRAQQ